MEFPARVLCVGGMELAAADPADVFGRADAPFEVDTVADASDALDRLASTEVDAVVCGSSPEDRDPLACLSTVVDRFPDVPVVFVAAETVGVDAPSVASEALAIGAMDYVRAEDVAAAPDLLVSRVTAVIDHHECERDLDRYSGLVSTVGDPMYVLEPDGTISFTNDAMLEMLGCEAAEVTGTHATETLSEGDYERGTELLQEILTDEDRDSGTFEVTVQPFEGEPTPAEINVAPLLDETGSYRATVGVVRDISERHHREQHLAALHDTTRRLIEATDVQEALDIGVDAAAEVLDLETAAFFRPDESGDVLEPVAVSDGVRELLGEAPSFERGEGLVWQAYAAGEPIFADDVGNRPGAYNPETPIGSEMLIPADDHGVFVAAATDTEGFDATDEELAGVLVSNLSRAIDSVRRADRLRARERELEQYETIVNTFPDEVYTLDAEGHFTSVVPPTGSELTTSGYEPEELIGEHVSVLMDEDDVAEGRALIEELVRSDERDRASFEMDIVTRDGDRIPNENHIALLTDGEAGSFRGTVGVLRNIADRKARERELERQNERLEAFAHIASHDLRNPLNVAVGRLELARAECESDHLDHLSEALDRMGTLIDDTLTMATEGEAVSTADPVDLGDLARRCWGAVPDDDATLMVGEEITVMADPDRLSRVLENLFRNAAEHVGPGVNVRVGALEDGFYVADDGPGIPEADRTAVFEAGHTTAEEGTGFGLAIVQEIVEAHGWEIAVTESESGGTRFEITGVTLA